MDNNKLTIIGAGPGDPDLITVKGMKALASAKVVLYDALVNKEVLKYTREDARLLNVGKRAGKQGYTQEDINQIIIENVLTHHSVVRLKGGDPFIFGRGFEEMQYIESFGIEVEVIPGITSATAIPATKKIPVTNREISQSFWVLTATKTKGEFSDDIKLAVKTNATVIILMGLNKLSQIVDQYRKEGKGNTPVAIIQDGTLESERAVYGEIDNIEKKKSENKIQTPALIVIGEVVRLRREILVNELSNLNYHEI